MTRTNRAIPCNEEGVTASEQRSAHLTAVLVATPGFAEQSLRAILESLPPLEVVGTAAGCLSALQILQDLQADLVVVDANLPPEDVRELLRQLRRKGLGTRSIVLAATTGQVRYALAAGADAALRRDASIGQLSAVVDRFQLGHTADTGAARP